MGSVERVIYITNAKILSGVFDSEALAFLRSLRGAGLRVDMIHFAPPGRQNNPEYRQKIEMVRERLAPGSMTVIENPRAWRGLSVYGEKLLPVLESLVKAGAPRTIIHSSGHLMSYAALQARKKALPWLKVHVDLRGVVADEHLHYGEGILPLRVIEYFLGRHMERTIVAQCDSLSCVSTAFRDYLTGRYDVEPEKIAVTPLCIDAGLFYFDPEIRREERKRLGWDDSIVFVYSGRRQKWQLVERVLGNMRLLLEEIPQGRGLILSVEREEFESDLSGLPPELRQRFDIRALPHDEVGRVLMAADVGLLFRKDDLVNRVACPTKFFEYLGSGLAVLCTEGIGDISAMAAEHGMGWVLRRPEDPERLDAAAQSLRANANGILSDEARKARSELIHSRFSWDSRLETILDRYGRMALGS